MKWSWLIVLIVLFAGPVIWSWDSDTIPVNNGFGWDGNMYGMYTQYLPEALEQGAINRFRMQRMLVPATVYGIMKQAGLERTPEQVILAYRVVNMVCIGLAMGAFLLLARVCKWYWETALLAFAALFFSMPFMKMSLFYPILADIPAFSVGMWAVYFWAKGWRAGLLVTILIGAFTGPTMWVYGLLLLPGSIHVESRTNLLARKWWTFLIPILFGIAWIWVWQTKPEVFLDPPSFSQSVRLHLLPVSLGIVFLYLWGAGQIVRAVPSMVERLRSSQWLWLIPFAGIILGVQYVIQTCAGPEEVPQTWSSYMLLLLQQSVTYPGGFLIAHFTYIPGIVLLGIFAAPYFTRIIQQFGPGPFALTLVVLGMALGTETRQLMQVLPWLVFLFSAILDKHWRFNPILLGILILVLWLAAPWWSQFAIEAGTLEGQFLQEPAQRYFRFHGPWMNFQSWQNQVFIFLGIIGSLVLSWKFGLIQSIGNSDSPVQKQK